MTFDDRRRAGDGGFSLIEVLVVSLIMGILTAVATAVFLSQRKKGWIAQSQSALKNAATAQESFATHHGGEYSAVLGPSADDDLVDEGFRAVSNVTITDPITVSGSSYCIVATHALLPPGESWKVSSYDSREGLPEPDDACND